MINQAEIKDIKEAVLNSVRHSGVKHAVFDLYGTLVDIHTDEENKNFWKKFAKYLRKHKIHYEYKELKKEYSRLCDSYKNKLLAKTPGSRVEINISDVFYDLCSRKKAGITRELSDSFGRYFRKISTEYIRVYDGVYDMLNELRKSGIKVWLLSNAQVIFTMPELEALDLVRYFDGIAISSDAGFKKPDAAFAKYLYEKYSDAGIVPGECLMVGNEYEADGGVAANSGMNFLYVVSNLTPENERSKQ